MISTLPQPETRVTIFSPATVMPPQEAAGWIIDSALKGAYTKLARTFQELPLEALLGQPPFFGDIKYGLARGIGQVLAATDERVTGVYVFEPNANPDLETGEELPLDGTIHLLVVVKTPSAALEAFIAGLDRALSQAIRHLPSPLLAGPDSLLNVIVLTAQEVEQNTGYGSLLSSMFSPPLRVW